MIFSIKDDNFINFKESFKRLSLSEECMSIIKKENIDFKDIVVGEFSGRDSAAAIIKSMERNDINVILPIVAFTGTDYGDINVFYKNWDITKRRIDKLYNKDGKNKILLPIHFMFEPKFWNALNGRFVVFLIKKYGYYTPCIGCHSYLRAIRIPTARHLSGKIVSGERLYHNNSFKIDQIMDVLNMYQKICNDFNIDLILPIKYIEDGEKIKEIIGYTWEQGKNQFSCVFSGNYRDKDGSVIFDREKVLKLSKEYVYLSTVNILKEGYKGNFKYIEIIKSVL